MATKRYSDKYWIWVSTPSFTASASLLVTVDAGGKWDFGGATILHPAPILRIFHGQKLKALIKWVNKKWPGKAKITVFAPAAIKEENF